MRYSVVIPVYNTSEYLTECVKSVLQMNNAEILLIDDGSTDNSGEICDRLAEEYNGREGLEFKVFHKENQGLLLTRRFGFRHASGDYIVSLDSDDMLQDGFFREISKVADKAQPDVIFYGANTFSLGRKTGNVSKADVLKGFAESTAEPFVSMWSKVFKRSMLDIEKDYDSLSALRFGEDTIQSAEVYSSASSFYYIDRPLYFYRTGAGVTSRYYENYYSDFSAVTRELLAMKDVFDVSSYEELTAAKYFNFVGRSVTQTRLKETSMTYKELRSYLKSIRDDSLYSQMKPYLRKVFPRLKPLYIAVNLLLEKKAYRLLHLLLSL